MAEAMEVQLSVDVGSMDLTSTVTDHGDVSRSAHPPDPQSCSVHTDWVHLAQHDHNYCKTASGNDVHDKKIRRDEIAYWVLRNDSTALLYSGIALKVFNILVSTLDGYANDAFTMSLRHQVLLTLMKLKTNRTIIDLSKQFCIPQSMASQIILYWIDKLEEVLRPLIPWLPKETIQATMPQEFKKNFPNTTCVVHCGKSFLPKPKHLDSRGDFNGYYYDLVKYVVAIAPCGLIMFISAAYGGRCRDKNITMQSGILDRLKPGDEVMADQSSSIDDLLLDEKGVKLVVPSITARERVASTRHVERAISHLKNYKVLSHVVSDTVAPKMNKILRICSALVNLR